jgi:hypothetical protein
LRGPDFFWEVEFGIPAFDLFFEESD